MPLSGLSKLFAMSMVLSLQFSAYGSVYDWLKNQKTSDETKEALSLIATLASQKSMRFAQSFEYACPVDYSFFDHSSGEQPKTDFSPLSNYYSQIVPLLAGKSIELLQNDLCRLLSSHLHLPEDVHAAALFCDKIENLIVSKATAKSLGKMTKGFQSGKSGFALFATGASTYWAVKLAERLSKGQFSACNFAAASAMLMFIEHSSSPEVLSSLTGEHLGDSYRAFDHWLARPFIYRTLTNAARYTLERQIQTNLFSAQTLTTLSHFFAFHFGVSQHSAHVLAKSYAIGSSKIFSGALAASVLSSTEMIFDSLRADPKFNGGCKRLQKFTEDVCLVIATNALISVTLPSMLLAGRPTRIITMFLLVNAIFAIPTYLDQGV